MTDDEMRDTLRTMLAEWNAFPAHVKKAALAKAGADAAARLAKAEAEAEKIRAFAADRKAAADAFDAEFPADFTIGGIAVHKF